MTRRSLMAMVVACSLLPTVVVAQQSRPRHSNNPPSGSVPDGEADPALETLTRAVAIQARPDQLGYFHSTIESTDSALEQSRELQRLGPAITNIPVLNARSLQLRDALDDVDHYNRRFLATFTKRQEYELKPLTKRVRKSYSFVEKASKTVAQAMEPGKVVAAKLMDAAANLEKALSDFRTDQIRLGREMGIQSK